MRPKDRKTYITSLETGRRIIFYESEPGTNGAEITRKPERRKEGGRAFYVRLGNENEPAYVREYIEQEL